MDTSQLKRSFRSRGISLIRQGTSILCRQKCYYDAENSLLPSSLRPYVEDGLLSSFEYSLNQSDALDTFNFHVTAGKSPDSLYEEIPERQRRVIDTIPELFDESFLLYTVGYRMLDSHIAGRTFYFYPTVSRENRIGIKGVEDSMLINCFFRRFSRFLKLPLAGEKEIGHYAALITKFKGVSVTVLQNGDADYKLYGRVPSQTIYSHLEGLAFPDLDQYHAFGDVALTAIRLCESGVKGYNLYYLS